MAEAKKDALTLVNAAIETLESELPPKEEPKDGSK